MRPVILSSTPAERAEQDCACPDGGLARLRPTAIETAGLWQIAPSLYRSPLASGHELIFDPFGYSNIVVLNSCARIILDSFNTPRALNTNLSETDTRSAINQFIALELLQPDGHTPKPIHSQPQTLTAWLHVTNACNLRCTYCYLNKTNSAMDEATGRAAVEAVFRSATRHNFRAVKFKYAGGEATLNFNLVMALHEHARELSKRNGLELHEVVLSNGVALTRAMIEYLRDENIRLMISLDGIGTVHDTQRMFANGHGSFTSVKHAIDRAVALDLSPHLSITVTAQNAEGIADAVNFALDRDLPFNLNFYRENDCTVSHSELVANQTRIVAAMKAAFAIIAERLPRRRLIDGLVDRSAFNEPHEYACGAGHNYFVIDQHGRVARCQMEIERTVTDVMVQDPLLAIRSHQSEFQNVPVNEKEGCRDCAWRYWCAGGCSLLTFRATGRTNVRSPYCEVYKALYPEVLRLEGLRLLKYATVES